MMSPASIADLQFEHFVTESKHVGTTIEVHMRGNADAQVHPRFQTFLEQLDVEARRLGVNETVIDFRELYFMNSSCLSLLLRWITSLSKSEKEAPYRIRFISNG